MLKCFFVILLCGFSCRHRAAASSAMILAVGNEKETECSANDPQNEFANYYYFLTHLTEHIGCRSAAQSVPLREEMPLCHGWAESKKTSLTSAALCFWLGCGFLIALQMCKLSLVRVDQSACVQVFLCVSFLNRECLSGSVANTGRQKKQKNKKKGLNVKHQQRF